MTKGVLCVADTLLIVYNQNTKKAKTIGKYNKMNRTQAYNDVRNVRETTPSDE